MASLSMFADWGMQPTLLLLWLVPIVQWVACGAYASRVAARKGYNWGPWLIGGIFFGLFALIAAAGLPMASTAATDAQWRPKACPECQCSCPVFASVCCHCGFRFPPESTVAQVVDLLLSAGEPGPFYRWLVDSRAECVNSVLDERMRTADWRQRRLLLATRGRRGDLGPMLWLVDEVRKPPIFDDDRRGFLTELARYPNPEVVDVIGSLLGRERLAEALLLGIGEAALPLLHLSAESAERDRAKAAKRVLKGMGQV